MDTAELSEQWYASQDKMLAPKEMGLNGFQAGYDAAMREMQALANTNPNAAEIQRLRVEIEVLQTLTVCPIQPSDVLAIIRLRRAQLAALGE